MEQFFSAIGGILLLDLVLSGDNALIIGAVAAELPKRQRFSIILIGGLGAVILRILLTYGAALLLNIPWLQTAGAIALLIIAVRLVMERYQNDEAKSPHSVPEKQQDVQRNFLGQVFAVLIADLTMSLDNVLAIGAIAHGNLLLLSVGLLLALVFLLIGSSLVAAIIGRLKWLIDVAALVLAWTSASMILTDLERVGVPAHFPIVKIALPVIALALIACVSLFYIVRMRRVA